MNSQRQSNKDRHMLKLQERINIFSRQIEIDKQIKKNLSTIAKKERQAEQQKLQTIINSPLNEAHIISIEHQVNGGIGGHRHQHGIPGGRYSAHGATSSHGGRRRSKPKGKNKGKGGKKRK